MTKNYVLFILFLVFLSGEIKAQDIHFTSYDFAPLTVNPALAGAFLGSYRVGGIYRDQWRSVSGQGAYSTPEIHVDMPVIRGIRKQDWIGIGVGVYRDASALSTYSAIQEPSVPASRYQLITTKSFQGISYHMALDKKQKNIISFGVQNGTANRKLDLNGSLRTESFILGQESGVAGTQDDALITSADGRTIIDWVGGVMYSGHQRNQSFIRAGLSVGRINRANQGFADTQDRQKLKYSAFAMYDFPISGNLFLTPQAFYQRTGNNQEFVAQTKASFLFDEAKGVYVNGGLGWRVGDALQLLFGFDYKDVKVQMAYDVNVSRLRRASNTVGSFEVGVSYIGKVYKKPKIDPTEVCPRL